MSDDFGESQAPEGNGQDTSPPPLPPVLPGRQRPRSGSGHPNRPAGGGRGWKVAVLILAVVLFFSLVGNLTPSGSLSPSGHNPNGEGRGLEEVVVRDQKSDHKVALLEVEGVISGMSLDGTGKSMVDTIKDQFKRAKRDDQVKAVILQVDSPGGEVLASDRIYEAVRDFQAETGKPVVAVMTGMAASGGYYVSAPCAWIVAHDLTITGSIGVIMQSYNYRGLMDKVGVSPLVFKSGKFKDMLGGHRPPEEILPEERTLVQDMVNETFERFKKVVREGRGKALELNRGKGRSLDEDWESMADGRIFSGIKAHDHGFVDELGDFESGLARALDLAGIPDAKVVKYQRLFDLGSIFRLLGQSEEASASSVVKVDLGLDLPRLQTGRMYFLSGHLFSGTP